MLLQCSGRHLIDISKFESRLTQHIHFGFEERTTEWERKVNGSQQYFIALVSIKLIPNESQTRTANKTGKSRPIVASWNAKDDNGKVLFLIDSLTLNCTIRSAYTEWNNHKSRVRLIDTVSVTIHSMHAHTCATYSASRVIDKNDERKINKSSNSKQQLNAKSC